jgi:hypothetical protein
MIDWGCYVENRSSADLSLDSWLETWGNRRVEGLRLVRTLGDGLRLVSTDVRPVAILVLHHALPYK